MNKFSKFILKLAGILFGTFAVLFSVFYFDLDGKLIYYVVEPFLKKHYDNMERKDVVQTPYSTEKYGKYEY